MDHRIVTRALLLLFLSWLNTNVWSQNPTRQYKSIASIPAGVKVTVSDGEYIFRSYGPNIIETTFIPNGQKHEANSHTVEKKPDENSFTWAASSNALIPPFIDIYHKEDRDKKMNPVILIQTNPFKITYWHKGKYLLSERWGYDVDSSMEKIQFNLSQGEKLFGTGNRVLGMDRRGYRLPLYNKAHYGYETHSEQMNYCMPLVISDRLYALHFDNSYTGFLDLDSKKDSSLTYETSGGRKTYQVIAADNWKELVTAYTSLTGRQPLPPRWTFGNFASRFGYHSEQEARKVVNQFRADSIPLDAIVFDLYWFGTTIQGTLGNFQFHKDSFPNPTQMISDFKNNGVKTVLITEPFILTTSRTWEETSTKKLLCTDVTGEKPFTYDFYFGNTGLLDIYKPETRQWFWDIYKGLIAMGVEGIWGDLGEPEVHPDELYHVNGRSNRVHNTYGHDWARLISDGYKADFPNQRPFILMRSGYSGSQRFGMIPWTGDVNRTWGGLKPQVELTLQAGLQGIGYLHSDLGGFGGANDDPELYVRWLQYGVFQPVFRPHAQQEVASEAIFKDPKTKALAKAAIEWRYRLLPYNYTLAYENSTTGIPLMRPVFLEYPDRKDFMERTDAYMWGPDIYVVPITEKGQQVSNIDFPDAHPWFNLFTDERIVPKQSISMARCFWGTRMRMVWNEPSMDTLTLDHIPVYVKAGAFIPMAKKGIQSTEEYRDNQVEIHFYYDPSVTSSSGQWFVDDGKTPQDFTSTCYTNYLFSYGKSFGKTSIIDVKAVSPNCKPFQTTVTLVIHNVEEMPRVIGRKNDKALGYPFLISFDKTSKTLRIPYALVTDNPLKIKFP
jgi:oligosaccharide 4-alpha-D-glucosyltransferase